MPVDASGTRADLVMEQGSTVKRMNLGRLYEQYLGAATYDVTRYLRRMSGIAQKPAQKAIKEVKALPQELFNQLYGYLTGFHSLISPRQAAFYTATTPSQKVQHLADVIDKGEYLYIPVDNEPELTDIVREVEKHYPPVYGPVTYRGTSGNVVTTKMPVRIGPMYFMLLDKISDDWSAISSGKLQHFGILSPATKSEKYAYPFHNSAVRAIGETEGRIFAGYCGREAIAEMMDRNNSPSTHRHVYEQVILADKPTNIYDAIDRSLHPYGGAKPLQLFNHIALVSGWHAVYEPEEKA